MRQWPTGLGTWAPRRVQRAERQCAEDLPMSFLSRRWFGEHSLIRKGGKPMKTRVTLANHQSHFCKSYTNHSTASQSQKCWRSVRSWLGRRPEIRSQTMALFCRQGASPAVSKLFQHLAPWQLGQFGWMLSDAFSKLHVNQCRCKWL